MGEDIACCCMAFNPYNYDSRILWLRLSSSTDVFLADWNSLWNCEPKGSLKEGDWSRVKTNSSPRILV